MTRRPSWTRRPRRAGWASWASVGTAIMLLGVVLASPMVVFIGAMVLLIRVLAEIWPRRALDALEFGRQVSHDRTVTGEEVELRLSLWNRTRLPVAWASATDTMSPGLAAASAGAEQALSSKVDVLSIAAALRPYEKVTRRFRLKVIRRGVHEVGPARLRVAELFGTDIPRHDVETEPLTILARPVTVPVVGSLPAQAPLARTRARRSLFPDPNLFAGVRPFQAGDPIKSIHWRASARQAGWHTKRFEPSLSGQAVLVFDVQTLEGAYWMLVYDEKLFEDLAVATLSVARDLVTGATGCGLAAATYSGTMKRFLYLPARADRPQLARIADALARLRPESSAPLTTLLAWLPNRISAGTMIIVLSARSMASTAPIARRLEQTGFPVHFLLLGDEQRAAEARQLGLSGWSTRVETEHGAPRAVAIGR